MARFPVGEIFDHIVPRLFFILFADIRKERA
jgi:hypothetical protein